MAPSPQSPMPYNLSPSTAPAIRRTYQFGDYLLPKYTFLQGSTDQLPKQLQLLSPHLYQPVISESQAF